MVFFFKSILDQFKMATKSASESVGEAWGGSRGAFWTARLPFGSCDRLRPQASQANQVIRRADQGEPPTQVAQTSQLHFFEQADHLHPTKGLFHPLAFLLADL